MNNKRMNIGLDFDGVLMNFYEGLCVFHNTNYGSNFTCDDIKSWELGETWGLTREEVLKEIYDYYHSSGHINISPVSGSVKAVESLCKSHSVSVITARPDSVSEQTVQWLKKHFPTLSDSIHFTNHFHGEGKRSKKDVCLELGIEVFVEDAPMHIKEISQHVKQSYLLDSPWNRKDNDFPSNVERVFSWDEIVNKITNLTSSNTDK